MRYLSRTNDPLTATQWLGLYLDRSYAVPQECRIGGHHVSLSWVGLACDRERRPKLFLVMVRPTLTEGGGPCGFAEEFWCSTEEGARAAFAAMVWRLEEELCEGVG